MVLIQCTFNIELTILSFPPIVPILSEIVPSFMLLDVQGDVMSVYIYRLVDDAVKVP